MSAPPAKRRDCDSAPAPQPDAEGSSISQSLPPVPWSAPQTTHLNPQPLYSPLPPDPRLFPPLLNSPVIPILNSSDPSTSRPSGYVYQIPTISFVTDGYDVRTVLTISLQQALLSDSFQIRLLGGKLVTISSPSVISPATEIVVEGEGAEKDASSGERGNLVVGFRITFPRELSEDKKSIIRGLALDCS